MSIKFNLFAIATTLLLFGCASFIPPERGMVEGNIFRSTIDPPIQIKVADTFAYTKAKNSNQMEHQFYDGNKMVYVEFYRNTALENTVDYYYPLRQIWSFANKIAEGEKEECGIKWYFCDYVYKLKSGCVLGRHMAMRNNNKDILFFRYGHRIYGSICNEFGNKGILTEEASRLYEELKKGFAKDIELSTYNSHPLPKTATRNNKDDNDISEKLTKIKKLYDKGVLSKDEYESKKIELLERL